jgi:hypothetical protein
MSDTTRQMGLFQQPALARVLAVYYSQSGQMRRILERVLAPLVAAGVEVVWAPIEPVPAYPFPWRVREFFDAFPESVAGIPCALRAPAFDPDGRYDLVVLGWQPWFLSPSIPAASFLRSEAGRVLAGRPVVTVVGARNMWLVAQEEIKRLVRAAGGSLVGNIALVDRAPNLVSAVTILRWMLRGRKEPFLGFPEAGVRAADVTPRRASARCCSPACAPALLSVRSNNSGRWAPCRSVPRSWRSSGAGPSSSGSGPDSSSAASAHRRGGRAASRWRSSPSISPSCSFWCRRWSSCSPRSVRGCSRREPNARSTTTRGLICAPRTHKVFPTRRQRGVGMETSEVYLTRVAAFLPNKPVSNEEMEQFLGFIGGRRSRSRPIVLRNNRITSRHYAIDREGRSTHTNAALTAEAVRRLYGQGFGPADLELLACGTTSPDQLLPPHASMVHGELGGAPAETVTFTGACLSGIDALKYAYLAVKSGQVRSAVAAGSEKLSNWMLARGFEEEAHLLAALEENPIIAFEKDFLRWMLSDGAGAALLAGSPAPGGSSLRVDWIDIVSYANEVGTCMGRR